MVAAVGHSQSRAQNPFPSSRTPGTGLPWQSSSRESPGGSSRGQAHPAKSGAGNVALKPPSGRLGQLSGALLTAGCQRGDPLHVVCLLEDGPEAGGAQENVPLGPSLGRAPETLPPRSWTSGQGHKHLFSQSRLWSEPALSCSSRLMVGCGLQRPGTSLMPNGFYQPG